MIRSISVAELGDFIPKATAGFSKQDRFLVRYDKVEANAIEAINNGYLKVFESDGEFCGFLMAHVSEMPFFDRLQATILGFQSWKPGAGDALIKDFIEWVDNDPFIRIAGWQNDTVDNRIDRFMESHGFESSTGYVYIKE